MEILSRALIHINFEQQVYRRENKQGRKKHDDEFTGNEGMQNTFSIKIESSTVLVLIIEN
jgi:hypothetical protein